MEKTGKQDWEGSDVFFARHPVFTTENFEKFLARRSGIASPSPEARKTLLKHHQARGRIVRVRRGLYAAVPTSQDAETYPVDTFLVASRLTDDAVLGYHTALSLHGVAHSVREERVALSQKRSSAFQFQGVTYRTTRPPESLPVEQGLTAEVEKQDRHGMKIRLTTLERTVVDVLDRPALAGGWEETWRSLEGIDVYLRAEQIVRYTLLLGNATTAAKVGYFLGQNRERLGIGDRYVAELRARRPKQPHYVERERRSDARLITEWNLLVPAALAGAGDDVGEDIPV